MGFSRQEYWSGLPFPSPGDLPDPGIEPLSLRSFILAGGFFTTSTTGKSRVILMILSMRRLLLYPVFLGKIQVRPFQVETKTSSYLLVQICYLLILFLFWPYHMACGVIVPHPGIEPKPSAVKAGLLTTGLPGNSLQIVFWML